MGKTNFMSKDVTKHCLGCVCNGDSPCHEDEAIDGHSRRVLAAFHRNVCGKVKDAVAALVLELLQLLQELGILVVAGALAHHVDHLWRTVGGVCLTNGSMDERKNVLETIGSEVFAKELI